MTGRSIGWSSPIVQVLIVVGLFLAAYTLVVHNRRSGYYSLQGYHSGKGGLLVDNVVEMPTDSKDKKREKTPFHVALTATNSTYSKWQCRIMYYWYKQQRDLPGSEMGRFTRILHSGTPDDLMDEIPTFVVDPLPSGLDRGYVVLNRPYAFVQWLAQAPIAEDYVLMAEPDHIFLRPLPNLAAGGHPAAYPFFYIKPEENEKIIRKYYPKENGPVTNVDPIGSSPVIIHKDLLAKIAPTWMNVSLKMKDDPETDEAFDWVLEMYGYAIASALHGVKHTLWENFMIQPPRDHQSKGMYILHYTYGCDYNMTGELTYGKDGEWGFNKRSYISGPPPRNHSLPPPGVPESVVTLVKMVNQATANIPNWEKEPIV